MGAGRSPGVEVHRRPFSVSAWTVAGMTLWSGRPHCAVWGRWPFCPHLISRVTLEFQQQQQRNQEGVCHLLTGSCLNLLPCSMTWGGGVPVQTFKAKGLCGIVGLGSGLHRGGGELLSL